MPRFKDEPRAVRVYTVCDESKYLIARNVPALGCGDELLKLFGTYGEVEECKPMDAEDCEPYTDVYWIKFRQFNNARFAKKKLDEFVFLGNRLQVSYGPQYESLADTKEKIEGRRKEVLARLNPGRSKRSAIYGPDADPEPFSVSTPAQSSCASQPHFSQRNSIECQSNAPSFNSSSQLVISSNQEYFPSQSMNQTVQLVREKLHKIQSSVQQSEAGSSKKARVDNRRRI